jgi:hypothetical protein
MAGNTIGKHNQRIRGYKIISLSGNGSLEIRGNSKYYRLG